MNKSSLLQQLRIDRNESPAPRGNSVVRWAIGVALLAIAAALMGWHLSRPTGLPIATALARPVSAPSSIGGTSLLDASGYIVARRRATVASKVTGKVVEVSLEEGQRVEAGHIIARLDDSNAKASLEQSDAQVKQAEAGVASAQAAYDDAKPIFERNEKQKAAAVISAQSYDEARAQIDVAKFNLLVSQRALDTARAGRSLAQRNVDDTVIRAPFTGIVTEKSAQPGEMVSPVSAGSGFTRTGICTLVDMNSLEAEVEVSENFINRVRPQQAVRIKLNAYPDSEFTGSVIAAIPTADRSKATVKVRIAIEQKDPRILPEMGAHVSFMTSADKSSPDPDVVIPPEAVTTSGDSRIVYVVHDSAVERRTVRLGARTDAGQIVTAGLDPGSTVAVGDLSRLRDGAKVRVGK